jgi:hypothetical protein
MEEEKEKLKDEEMLDAGEGMERKERELSVGPLGEGKGDELGGRGVGEKQRKMMKKERR